MSTTPPPPTDENEGSEQPTADLSELAATDALLDRLGARSPSEQDLLDPTAMALSSLLADIDADTGADSAAARLVEVLAGRPLYIDGPSVAPAGEELIDLTSPDPVPAVEDEPEQDDETGGGRPVPITAARSQRWKVAASKVSAPVAAASIAVMVLLGGGVSAAVTGSPLSPLSGVGSVVAKLPGVSGADEKNDNKLKEAQAELAMARELVISNPTQAAVHLATAKQMLSELPDEDTADLDKEALYLAGQLPAEPGDPTLPSEPGVTSVAATGTPGVTATPEGPSTATPTVPVTGVPATSTPTTPAEEPTTPTTTTTTGGGEVPSTPPTTSTTAPNPPADTGTGTGSLPSSSTSTTASSNSAPETTPAAAPTGN